MKITAQMNNSAQRVINVSVSEQERNILSTLPGIVYNASTTFSVGTTSVNRYKVKNRHLAHINNYNEDNFFDATTLSNFATAADTPDFYPYAGVTSSGNLRGIPTFMVLLAAALIYQLKANALTAELKIEEEFVADFFTHYSDKDLIKTLATTFKLLKKPLAENNDGSGVATVVFDLG